MRHHAHHTPTRTETMAIDATVDEVHAFARLFIYARRGQAILAETGHPPSARSPAPDHPGSRPG
jgi:hypothetical protein